ncbi:hypothetical protein MYX77_08180 [Acidobacteriia bacterium AH_259_A11_L15]|nr:hypothetical protein [Acidobacteriia bacterium AH_259_A11_L15]
MSRRTRKIIIAVLVIVIGLPVAFMVTAVVWFSMMDKTNGTIVSSGQTRQYLLYVPKTYDPSKATPLVISMHAAPMWPAAQMEISRWNELADEHGFIVAYPSGTDVLGILPRGPKVWRVNPGRGPEVDATFISDLIDKLEAEYNIDPTRIYADGLSNGGGMSFVVSCRLSHRVAAVGAVAAAQTLPFDWCGDSRPVPMVAFHGTDDRMVPYEGGPSGDPFNPITFPAVRDWAASWVRRNQCSGDPIDARVTASVRRLAYTNCAENADVILYTVEGGGHSWPGGKPMPEWMVGRTTRDISATSVMWAFFVQDRRGPK